MFYKLALLAFSVVTIARMTRIPDWWWRETNVKQISIQSGFPVCHPPLQPFSPDFVTGLHFDANTPQQASSVSL